MPDKFSFIFATDFHFGAKSRIRKDDLEGALLTKLQYILEKRRNDEVLLLGGDLLDRPDGIPYRTLSKIMDVFSAYNIRKDNTFAVFGQHEIYGHNPETIKDSLLDVFVRAGFITLLYGKNRKISFGWLDLVGYSWNEKEKDRFLSGNVNFEKPTVVIIHDSISPHPRHRLFSVNPLGLVVPENTVVVLCGDIHDGFNMTGKFVNPGAVIRKKREESDRIVKFLRGEVYPSGEIKIENVEIPVEQDVFLSSPVPSGRVENIREILDQIDDMDFDTILIPVRSPIDEILSIVRSKGFGDEVAGKIKELFGASS